MTTHSNATMISNRTKLAYFRILYVSIGSYISICPDFCSLSLYPTIDIGRFIDLRFSRDKGKIRDSGVKEVFHHPLYIMCYWKHITSNSSLKLQFGNMDSIHRQFPSYTHDEPPRVFARCHQTIYQFALRGRSRCPVRNTNP